MYTVPLRPADPDGGYHRVIAERRFRYITRDPAHELLIKWIAEPVACPVCETDTFLQLILEDRLDQFVRAYCPGQHEWIDTRIDPHHFRTYSRLQLWADPDPDDLWIMNEGFGEEPPPPIDYAADITQAAKHTANHLKRRAKSKAKSAVHAQTRRAGRAAKKTAAVPVAAALRAAWLWQAGGLPQAPATAKPKADNGPAIPSVAKYRKAYGMPAPAKGPTCLVCEDSGTIPGTTIPCTECDRPAAALAAAERRAERARQGR